MGHKFSEEAIRYADNPKGARFTGNLHWFSASVVASVIGILFVRSGEKADQKELLAALRRGIFISAGLIAVSSYLVIRLVLGVEFIGVYWAVLSGLVAGIIMGLSTEYFTSDKYSPTRRVARSASTGPATVIITGLSVGMLSTIVPVVVVAMAILAGGNVRVGLEDNLWLGKGVLASNGDLVERARTIVEGMGSQIMSPQEVREKLNLKKRWG